MENTWKRSVTFGIVYCIGFLITSLFGSFYIWLFEIDPLITTLFIAGAAFAASVCIIYFYGSRIRRLTGTIGEEFWEHVIVYAFVLLISIAVIPQIVHLFTSTPIMSVIAILLAVQFPYLVILLQIRGYIHYPSWLTAEQWGVWDYVALFGSASVIALVYLGGLTQGLGLIPMIVGVFLGFLSVILKNRRVLSSLADHP